MKKIVLGLGMASALTLTACTTTPSGSDVKTSTAPITDKTWIVTHINGEAVSTKPTDHNIPSLQLDSKEQRFSGADGCNRLMGSYTVTGSQITFGQIAGTMMACLDENIQKTSQSYTKALEQAKSYDVTPSTLILKDQEGKAVVQFTTAVQPR